MSEKLQGVENDIFQGLDSIKSCEDAVKLIRNDSTFQTIFQNLEEKLDCEIRMPRIVSNQRNRSNAPASDALEYYTRNVFLPYVDCILSQLQERFSGHESTWQNLRYLIPKYSKSESTDNLEKLLKTVSDRYLNILPGNIDDIRYEYIRWKTLWTKSDKDDEPQTILESFRTCHMLGK